MIKYKTEMDRVVSNHCCAVPVWTPVGNPLTRSLPWLGSVTVPLQTRGNGGHGDPQVRPAAGQRPRLAGHPVCPQPSGLLPDDDAFHCERPFSLGPVFRAWYVHRGGEFACVCCRT